MIQRLAAAKCHLTHSEWSDLWSR